SDIEELARKYQVCGHELSLDISEWVDVVICDYNYVFDPAAYLKRHFNEGSAKMAFLIDEAHNLLERARDMFSAQLDFVALREVKAALKKKISRAASALGKAEEKVAALREGNQEARVLEDLPKEVLGDLERFVEAVEAWLAKHGNEITDEVVMD